MRWLYRALVVLVLAIVVVAGGGYLWLRGSLPVVDGRIAAVGLSSTIEIVRDRNGVPHIYARSPIEAQFGLGFVHAQDRLCGASPRDRERMRDGKFIHRCKPRRAKKVA